MEYIGVYLINLPVTVRGFTVLNSDNSYSIFLNARLSSEMQRQTYDHEISHINNNDYDYFYNINDLETLRHVV